MGLLKCIHRRSSPAQTRARAGFTLLEMILATVVIALISTAVCTLITGAMNSDRYVRSSTAAQAEVELATRRLTHNLQTAQTGQITLTGTNSVTVVSQPDPTNGYANGATVVYSLRTNPSNSSQQQLIENDPRYGGINVVANNVTTFQIALVSGFVDLYQIDLVLGSQPPAERHFKVYNRN